MENAHNSSHEDSVHGGSMSQGEFYYAEFQVDEDFPNWRIDGDGKVFNMTVNEYELSLDYNNTIIYLFEDEFEWFSHLYIIREEPQVPLYVMLPEDEQQREAFIDMMDEMICAGFKLRTQRYPEAVDFKTMHKRLRGEEDIEDILGRILVEGMND